MMRNLRRQFCAPSLRMLLPAFVGLLLLTSRLAGGAEETNAPAATSPAPVTNSPPSAASSPSQDYPSFKIIAERNIFNPNRRPGLSQRPRAVRSEAFSLVGTQLDEETGTFAFFDGTGSQYKKVLKLGETIAGYKVCEIAFDSVKLEADDNQIEMPMGMQMKRQEEEKWQLVLGTAVSGPSSPSSPSSSLSSSSNSAIGNRDRSSDFGRRDRSSDSGRRGRGSNFGGRNRSADSGPRERISTSTGSIDAGFEVRADVVADAGTEAGAVPEAEVKPDGGSSSGGAADDVIKKLMQRREQELSK